MKKLGAILFVIVLFLGLPFVAGADQHVDIVNPDGVVSFGGAWWTVPAYEDLNDWDSDPDASFITTDEQADLTLDFQDPPGGPYAAIIVKLRASSDGFGSELSLKINAGVEQIGGEENVTLGAGLQEYTLVWEDMPRAADLVDLQAELAVNNFTYENLRIFAIQVELVLDSRQPAPELKADFTANPTSVEEGQEVVFTDESTFATGWEWDFGDGSEKSTEQNPSHIYESAGTYTVSLTVTGSGPVTETKPDFITVTPAYVPVLEARTRSFHSHRYGERVCVRLRVKNVSDERLHKIGVAMFSADAPDADRTTWKLLKERERTFHRRWPLKPDRSKNVWLRYNSDESLSGKYLILEVYPVEGEFGKAATFEKAETNDKVSVKILVP